MTLIQNTRGSTVTVYNAIRPCLCMLLLLIGAMIQSEDAWTQVTAPETLVNRDELLEIGVSAADAVVVAELRETGYMAIRAKDDTSTFVRVAIAALLVTEVIKGNLVPGELSVRIPMHGSSPSALQTSFRNSRVGVFFLEQRGQELFLISDRSPSQGALPIPDQSIIAEFRGASHKQRLPSVARSATVIVVASKARRVACFLRGTQTTCIAVDVDSVIVGTVKDSVLTIFCPFPPAMSFGRAVFMLNPIQGGVYALAGHHAGIVATHDQRGRALKGVDRTDVVRRIVLARLGMPAGRD